MRCTAILSIEALLQPVSLSDPSGIDVQHDLYAKIREARRQEDPELRERLEAGAGTKAKKANFTQVVALAEDGLATKSKDLWLAVWLCDALIHEERLAGFRRGLELTSKLAEEYWESVYPKLDGEDPWPRFGALDWLGDYCDAAQGSSPILALRLLSITELAAAAGELAGTGGADAARSKSEARKKFYRAAAEDVAASRESVAALETFCKSRFGDEPPSFAVLGRTIEELRSTIESLLDSEIAAYPEAIQPQRETATLPPEISQTDIPRFESSWKTSAELPLNGEVQTTSDAIRHITAAARFLHRASPADPVPYLLLRALRWGELRGANNGRFEELLESPPAELRVAVRRQAQAGEWATLLATAEQAMSTGYGRGWLDLQRYVVLACDKLGYELVAQALRSELKQLLADMPQLATATLLDDTGAANPDTAAWLRQEGFTS